jgi:hypothetical protein
VIRVLAVVVEFLQLWLCETSLDTIQRHACKKQDLAFLTEKRSKVCLYIYPCRGHALDYWSMYMCKKNARRE